MSGAARSTNCSASAARARMPFTFQVAIFSIEPQKVRSSQAAFGGRSKHERRNPEGFRLPAGRQQEGGSADAASPVTLLLLLEFSIHHVVLLCAAGRLF